MQFAELSRKDSNGIRTRSLIAAFADVPNVLELFT
jgi:hypothetical protein